MVKWVKADFVNGGLQSLFLKMSPTFQQNIIW